MKEAERRLYEKGYYLSNQFDGFFGTSQINTNWQTKTGIP